MTTTHEMEVEDGVFISGDVVVSKDSFDHALGREEFLEYEVRNLRVYYLSKIRDRDVTELLKRSRPEDYYYYEDALMFDYANSSD